MNGNQKLLSVFADFAGRWTQTDEEREKGSCVAEFLSRFAQRMPAEPTPEEIAVLERLGRKVDVAGKVWAAYDSGWNKPATGEYLARESWPVLIAAFLYVAGTRKPGEVEGRGRALRMVNSAFNAIELARSCNGDFNLEPLPVIADNSLVRALAL